jgi:hypothetical protein
MHVWNQINSDKNNLLIIIINIIVTIIAIMSRGQVQKQSCSESESRSTISDPIILMKKDEIASIKLY